MDSLKFIDFEIFQNDVFPPNIPTVEIYSNTPQSLEGSKIDWGDGNLDIASGEVTFQKNGGYYYTVSPGIAHTYTREGNFIPSQTINDFSIPGKCRVWGQPSIAYKIDINIVNSTTSGVLRLSLSESISNNSKIYSEIDWGDGNMSKVIIDNNNSIATLNIKYSKSGTYTIKVSSKAILTNTYNNLIGQLKTGLTSETNLIPFIQTITFQNDVVVNKIDIKPIIAISLFIFFLMLIIIVWLLVKKKY